MATAQSNAVSVANQAISLAQQLLNLLTPVNALVNQYTDQGVSTVWAAFATCAQNSDGSLGTADGTPVNTHPINSGLAAFSGLSATVTSNGLVDIIGKLQDFQAFMNGTAVTTANRRQALNQDING